MGTTDALARAGGGGDLERPTTGPGRPLGQKRKPQLRLALGYRDEQRRGAPVKTDYFIPHGNDIAVRKFHEVYGDKPRAIDVRLPSTLGGFLDIRHVAFAGGQNEGGGSLKAIGAVNFAIEGTLGGPDKLTVFDIVDGEKTGRDGKPIPQLQTREVYIEDVTDQEAVQLGVYLQATIAFGIPDVLGFGGICEIRSRGKETIDTLWETAVDIYSNLGQNASMVLRPKLVLKESTMITPLGVRSPVWVVDLYVPESMDAIVGRLRELRELTPAGPSAALYGAAAGELAAGAPPDAPEAPPVAHQPAESVQREPEPTDSDENEAEDVDGEVMPDEEADMAALEAGQFELGFGKYRGQTLEQINETASSGDSKEARDAYSYLGFLMRKVTDKPDVVQAVWAFCRVYQPALFHEVLGEKEAS